MIACLKTATKDRIYYNGGKNMKKLLQSLIILSFLTCAIAFTGNLTDTALAAKSNSVAKPKNTQKKLPPCDEFLKDWGGRGGYTAQDDNAMGSVAPAGCYFKVDEHGCFVPTCDVDGKKVIQCDCGKNK